MRMFARTLTKACRSHCETIILEVRSDRSSSSTSRRQSRNRAEQVGRWPTKRMPSGMVDVYSVLWQRHIVRAFGRFANTNRTVWRAIVIVSIAAIAIVVALHCRWASCVHCYTPTPKRMGTLSGSVVRCLDVRIAYIFGVHW